jgi:hypothetical protein
LPLVCLSFYGFYLVNTRGKPTLLKTCIYPLDVTVYN